MSIEDTEKIDIIATRPDSHQVRLVIADHLDWSDAESHLLHLQDKVNSYIEFIESGQVLEQPNIPADPEVAIHIEFAYELPDAAMAFLRELEPILADAGIGMSMRVLA